MIYLKNCDILYIPFTMAFLFNIDEKDNTRMRKKWTEGLEKLFTMYMLKWPIRCHSLE